MVRYCLYLTVAKIFLIWDGVSLIMSLMVGYDINFVVIIRFELHALALGELTKQPFLSLSTSFALRLV